MTLKYVVYGFCFGWLFMPRWGRKSMRIPLKVMGYTIAVIISMLIAYYFDYDKQSWLFVVGMAAHLSVFAAIKWSRYLLTTLVRKIKS